MGSIRLAPEIAGMLRPDTSEQIRRGVLAGAVASRIGLPINLDMWDGYPAARDRLLRSALDADANLVVLSGDSHNAWAFDLDRDGTPAGVEFAVQSVTSPGYEHYLGGVAPADLARVTIAANPQLRWTDLSRRGYLTVDLTPDRVTGEWIFMETIRDRSTNVAARQTMSAARGANRLG